MQSYSQTPNRQMEPIVVFYNDTKENKHRSHETGKPEFDDVEMVRITFPADRQRTLVKPAHSSAMVYDERGKRSRRVGGKQVSYSELYRDQYRAFKANQAPSVRGTPISEAPFLTEAQRRSLKALEVYTIEQLAAVKPGTIGMGGVEMAEKAKAYLANAAGSADVTKMAADNAAQRAEIERLRAELAARAPAPESQADEYEGFSDEELKAEILARGGALKPGRPTRATLIATLEELASK